MRCGRSVAMRGDDVVDGDGGDDEGRWSGLVCRADQMNCGGDKLRAGVPHGCFIRCRALCMTAALRLCNAGPLSLLRRQEGGTGIAPALRITGTLPQGATTVQECAVRSCAEDPYIISWVWLIHKCRHRTRRYAALRSTLHTRPVLPPPPECGHRGRVLRLLHVLHGLQLTTRLNAGERASLAGLASSAGDGRLASNPQAAARAYICTASKLSVCAQEASMCLCLYLRA